MAIRNNRIVVDLNKVQYAYFYYRNQYGNTKSCKPAFSVHGEYLNPYESALFHPDFPNETIEQRCNRLNMTDVWHFELLLKLQANSCLIYTGDKALSLWKAWQAKQFGNKKK